MNSKHYLANSNSKVCQFCDKTFHYNSKLEEHIALIHEKKTLTECEICGKIFATKRTAKLHIEIIHNKLQYSCAKCERHFWKGW